MAGFAIGAAAWVAVLAQTSHQPSEAAPAHRATPPDGVTTRHAPREAAPAHAPIPRIIEVLDANQDWEISAEEIAQAAEALKTLDANHDGKLTMDEILPAHPARSRAVQHRPEAGGETGRRGAGAIRRRPAAP